MQLNIDSQDVKRDDLFVMGSFIDDISLRDLLVFRRMINIEVDRRAEIMDRR